MIIISSIPLEIGEVVNTGFINDHLGNPHKTPFKVLREATYEEYLEYRNQFPDAAGYTFLLHDKFYEVSID